MNLTITLNEVLQGVEVGHMTKCAKQYIKGTVLFSHNPYLCSKDQMFYLGASEYLITMDIQGIFMIDLLAL